jgi:UDPglucose 6-dehydrogenase
MTTSEGERPASAGADVAVVGAGYVGLTTAACLAHLGHRVLCADIVPERIEALSRGEVPIVEQGLDQLVAEGLETGRLRFVVGAAQAARSSEFVYLSVPTPQGADGAADLSFIEAAAREIGPVLPVEAVVINKSTVPVGSTRVVEKQLGRSDVYVVSNPEFLREGSAVSDFLEPDRVVIGSDDQSAAIRVAALYVGVPAPLMVTDPASAETIKYASNAFLATKLSFVNAVAAVCEAVGADVSDVVLGMGYDERIGHEFLRPGPGWGGSCFPKDSAALVRIAERAGYDFELLKGVIAVNDEQFDRVADKIEAMVGGDLSERTVAVWGLTFKAGTDDLRESPSLEVIRRLVDRGARVRAHDPTVEIGPAGDPWDRIEIGADPYAVCDDADVLAVLTEWDEYRWLDFDKVAEAMAAPRCVDTRNLLERARLLRRGFDYVGIGRS